MTIIEASSVGVRTLVDGTLRLTVDIEPRHAQAAFALFGAPGVPVALAALKALQERAQAEPNPEPPPEKPKGGAWSKWIAMRCNDSVFQSWLRATFQSQWKHCAANVDGPRIDNGIIAAHVVRKVCEIQSRAELDNDPMAMARFNERIRGPWQKYYAASGLGQQAGAEA